jgi:type IV pilus assembly protein PilV
MKKRNATLGFSLVEVLVALVVLSVGMLGIAALYVESLRFGSTAQLRTQAVALASDMADRIRANRQGLANYTKGVGDVGALDAACDPGGVGCTPDIMAAHDIFRWNETVNVQLPGAQCSIAVDVATTPATYTIVIQWSEPGQVDPLQYTMSIQA